MAITTPEHRLPVPATNGAGPAPVPQPAAVWANAAPLGLAAFAVTTFMLSMVNANLINKAVEPVVFAVALMFGGAVQLCAGLIELRRGKVFTGTLFCSFGAFWLCLFALVQFYLKQIPPAQVGQAFGLLLYGFGILAVVMLAASLRTNAIIVAALVLLSVAIFLLAGGNYGAHVTMIHWGGYLGLIVAALAGYLVLAETCEASYGRSVCPVWPLQRT